MDADKADWGVPLNERERGLGLRVLRLVLGWSDWVHRRVETVHFESAEAFRRRVSVDFTLPRDLKSPIEDGDNHKVYLTPLTLLRKEPLTNFDLKDEGGRALPLLTKERNGSLAAALLTGLASTVAPNELRERHGPRPPLDVEQALLRLALSDRKGGGMRFVASELAPSSSDSAAASAWRSELLGQSGFLAVARALTANYLVVVPLASPPGTRRIVKLAYDEPRSPKPRRRGLSRRGVGLGADVRVIDTPAVSYGSSYHLEFVAPDGLIITRGDLTPHVGTTLLTSMTRSVRESRRRASLYLPVDLIRAQTSTMLGRVQGRGGVWLRPPPSTLVRSTALLSIFTAALLLFVALRWESLADNAGIVPSLLLIVPAGLAALIARPGEASIATQLLFGVRLQAVVVALCAYLAAAVLVGGRSCRPTLLGETCSNWSSTPVLLYALFSVVALTAIMLGLVWRFSASPPEQGLAGPRVRRWIGRLGRVP